MNCNFMVYETKAQSEIHCGCEHECYSEIYDKDISSTLWPSNWYIPYLAVSIFKTESERAHDYCCMI